MCFIRSFHPQPCVQRYGTVVGQSTGVTSGGAVSKRGPQPHAEDSRDGVEEPLKPLPARQAFARCIHIAIHREGLAEVGLQRLPPGCWWDVHHQQPPSEGNSAAAGT